MNDGNGTNAGHVRVFNFICNTSESDTLFYHVSDSSFQSKSPQTYLFVFTCYRSAERAFSAVSVASNPLFLKQLPPAPNLEVQRRRYSNGARSERRARSGMHVFIRRPRPDAAPSSRHGDAFRPVAVQKRLRLARRPRKRATQALPRRTAPRAPPNGAVEKRPIFSRSQRCARRTAGAQKLWRGA